MSYKKGAVVAELSAREQKRYEVMSVREKDLYASGYQYVAGVDEVGRGPLAGPVVAAAVILPPNYWVQGLNDSKKMSEKKRDEVFDCLKQDALAYGFGIVSETMIDEMNIRQATLLAMKMALEQLQISPDYVLVDGNMLPDVSFKQEAMVKGDSRSVAIAAASVLAKVTRDRMMKSYAELYPEYGFEQHKGYGTPFHLHALSEHGFTSIHRKSFEPVKSMVKLQETLPHRSLV